MLVDDCAHPTLDKVGCARRCCRSVNLGLQNTSDLAISLDRVAILGTFLEQSCYAISCWHTPLSTLLAHRVALRSCILLQHPILVQHARLSYPHQTTSSLPQSLSN